MLINLWRFESFLVDKYSDERRMQQTMLWLNICSAPLEVCKFLNFEHFAKFENSASDITRIYFREIVAHLMAF